MTDATGSRTAAVEHLLVVGRPARAEELARSLLAGDPEQPQVLCLLAEALLEQDRVAEALETVHRAVALAPEVAETHRLLAVVAATGHRRDLAEPAIATAVELAPESPAAHQTHAQLLLAFDRRPDALVAADTAVRLAPHHVGPAVVRAACLVALRRWVAADLEVQRALRLDPNDVAAQHLGAELAVRRGRPDAEGRSREVLRLRPTDVDTRRLVVRSLQSRYRVVRAFVRFEVWLDGLPTGAQWAVRLGPFVILRFLRVLPSHFGLVVALPVVAFVLATWTTGPVTMLLLMRRAQTRKYLDAPTQRTALAFGAFVAATVGMLVAAVLTEAPPLVLATFALGVWTLAVGGLSKPVSPHRGRMVTALAGIAVTAVAVGGIVAPILGRTGPAMIGLGVAVIAGVASLWAIGL